MKRLHVFMLAFNRLSMCEEALRLFKRSSYPIASLTVFDPGFPGLNSEDLEAIAAYHGFAYHRMPENRGVSENWRYAIEHLGLTDGDVLFGLDPDARIAQDGYLDAVMEVMNNAPECYYVGMNQPFTHPPMRFPRRIGAANAYYHPQLCAWSVGAFDIGWMKKINGPLQPHGQYGYLEHATSAAAAPLGGQFYMLADFVDHHLQSCDTRYTAWKHACVNGDTHLDFATWLATLDGNA